MSKHRILSVISIVAVVILCVIFYMYNESIEKEPLVSTEGRTFQKAVVTEIVQDNLQEGGVRSGYQTIMVELLTGDLKGQTLEATSSDGNLFGAVCTVGMKVVVIVSTTENGSTISVYSQDREAANYIFIAVFLLLICAIGGRAGVKSVIGLVFTCLTLLFLFLPMLYVGVSPFLAAVLVSALTTTVSMYFIGGASKKTVSAIIGTVIGVCMSGLTAYIYGKAAGISGYNVSDIETLLFVAQNTEIQVGGLLFAGILISSLGAVMDVAMSISSTICEIHEKNLELGSGELFKSGMRVGRDMMGTMSNTLILAFIGGSLSVLLTNYAYVLPYLQVINSPTIGIEIMQGISGSMGVILTVPCVSFISAVLFGRRETKCVDKE